MSENGLDVAEDFEDTVQSILSIFGIPVERGLINTGVDTVITCSSKILEFSIGSQECSLKVVRYEGEVLDDACLVQAVVSSVVEGEAFSISSLTTVDDEGNENKGLTFSSSKHTLDDEGAVMDRTNALAESAYTYYERLDNLLLDIGVEARSEFELQKYYNDITDDETFQAHRHTLLAAPLAHAEVCLYVFAGTLYCRLDIENAQEELTYEYDVEDRKLLLIIDGDDEYSLDCTLASDHVEKFHDICMSVFKG